MDGAQGQPEGQKVERCGSWLGEYQRLIANGLSPYATHVAVWPNGCRSS